MIQFGNFPPSQSFPEVPTVDRCSRPPMTVCSLQVLEPQGSGTSNEWPRAGVQGIMASYQRSVVRIRNEAVTRKFTIYCIRVGFIIFLVSIKFALNFISCVLEYYMYTKRMRYNEYLNMTNRWSKKSSRDQSMR